MFSTRQSTKKVSYMPEIQIWVEVIQVAPVVMGKQEIKEQGNEESTGGTWHQYNTQGGGGVHQGLLNILDIKKFNDIYMMNFTSERPKWLKTVLIWSRITIR